MSYHTLSQEEFDEIRNQIEALNGDNDVLEAIRSDGGQSAAFVSDMRHRLARYGRDIKCSPGQRKWLGDLFDRYVAGTANARESQEDTFTRYNRQNEIDKSRRR